MPNTQKKSSRREQNRTGFDLFESLNNLVGIPNAKVTETARPLQGSSNSSVVVPSSIDGILADPRSNSTVAIAANDPANSTTISAARTAARIKKMVAVVGFPPDLASFITASDFDLVANRGMIDGLYDNIGSPSDLIAAATSKLEQMSREAAAAYSYKPTPAPSTSAVTTTTVRYNTDAAGNRVETRYGVDASGATVQSTDGGATWTASAGAPAARGNPVVATPAPSSTSAVTTTTVRYNTDAAGNRVETRYGVDASGATVQSTDGGNTWTASAGAPTARGNPVVAAPATVTPRSTPATVATAPAAPRSAPATVATAPATPASTPTTLNGGPAPAKAPIYQWNAVGDPVQSLDGGKTWAPTALSNLPGARPIENFVPYKTGIPAFDKPAVASVSDKPAIMSAANIVSWASALMSGYLNNAPSLVVLVQQNPGLASMLKTLNDTDQVAFVGLFMEKYPNNNQLWK